MKVIIAGSRNINEYDTVKPIIDKMVTEHKLEITEVVSGGANGVDRLGERWALENGVAIKRVPAKWDLYGRSAGVIRNKEMADYSDSLIAIWDGKSKGTRNMIETALAKAAALHSRPSQSIDPEMEFITNVLTYVPITSNEVGYFEACLVGEKLDE